MICRNCYNGLTGLLGHEDTSELTLLGVDLIDGELDVSCESMWKCRISF